MTTDFVDLDVRPILRDGGEPFEVIMKAIAGLAPNQGLRLFATFKPTPLFQVLGAKGFSHEAKELVDGEWEILFSPDRPAAEGPIDVAVNETNADEWPEPVQHMDNRDLEPPEPMVRVLAALESLRPGDVLEALLCREPMFLFPELAKRGHAWRGAFEADGTTYKILVRVDEGGEPTA